MSVKIFVLSLGVILCLNFNICAQTPAYKNSELSTEERVEDLLSRMTLEEKIGQLLCPLGWPMYEKLSDSQVDISEKYKNFIKKQHGGMLWAVFRADPWTRKTLENGLNPELAAETYNKLQKYAIENSRLGIPIIFAEEAPHGHMAIGTTVYPTGMGMASTWDRELLKKEGQIIAKELRAQGGHIAYGPIVDLTREVRWSRVEETFGEDPYLIAELISSLVKGMSPKYYGYDKGVISTLKHFIAYGVPEAGHNGNPSVVTERDILEIYLPPFKAAIDAGALSIMTSYNALDGIPSTSNYKYLTDVLYNEWKFNGFVVSDLESIDGLYGSHRVAESKAIAGEMAIEAGVDVDLGANCFALLSERVEAGELSVADIDRAVSRVLKIKFDLGLFDNPYVDVNVAESVRSAEHVENAREVARKSITLLENNGILPLSKNMKVAVIGPNADNQYNQLGDYTAPQDPDNVVTVLEGIKAAIGEENVTYAKGCAVRDTKYNGIKEALKAVRKSDVAVVVVGGSSARDFKTKYIDTGAAVVNESSVSDMECGEGFDRSDLELLGLQNELLKEIKRLGKPMVVVYIEGRPLEKNWAKENADALLTAWYPGGEGGHAIADVIFGDYNPAGRLPISVPRSVGQLPVYYNKDFPLGGNYVEMSRTPLYPFGYGLSYTKFEYSNLKIKQSGKCEYKVSFTLKNIGDRDGEEVAQLYLTDEYASVVRPMKQLKSFERVFLRKGETKTIEFTLDYDSFKFIGKDYEWIVEPGKFLVNIGASSDDYRLNGEINLEAYQCYEKELCSVVDPMIGTGGHGHVFVGANMPFGMVQLGPQQPNKGWDWCSGYHYSGEQIIGFSHTHLSGTGIGERGDFLFMPYSKDVVKRNEKGQIYAKLNHAAETVTPGYYSIFFDEYKILAEMTAGLRNGFHRYTAASNDISVHINLVEGIGWDELTQCHLDKISSRRIAGWRRSKGWAKDHAWYFVAEFSHDLPEYINAESGYCDINFNNLNNNELLVKVAISSVSVENAILNLESEITSWDFDSQKLACRMQWEKELSKVSADCIDARSEKLFYTSLYHTMFFPCLFSDVNGEYRGADAKIHRSNKNTYTIFSLWDTYRAASPLLTISNPDFCKEISSTLLNVFQQQGKLPVWHLDGNETDCMVGNPGVIVMADLYLKGLVEDKDLAYKAMLESSMLDERDMDLLKKYNYIPFDKSDGVETVAKCMEYAIADGSLAKVAKLRADEANYEYFTNRSHSYRRLFDAKEQFVKGVDSKGKFRKPFDPFKALHMKSDYTEGNAWQYTWLAPHDLDGLIDLFGSRDAFEKKLDEFFVAEGDLGGDANDVTGLIGQYAHGNEPSHHIAYIYSHIGKDHKCAKLVREVMDSLYFDDHSGVCGNEDAGQMSAWYIMSALGLYQIDPAGGVFYVGSPLVNNVVLRSGTDNEFRIIVENNSSNNIYVESIYLNGKKLYRNWISWDEISKAGELRIIMSNEI